MPASPARWSRGNVPGQYKHELLKFIVSVAKRYDPGSLPPEAESTCTLCEVGSERASMYPRLTGG